jgi:hypothetical protein
MNYLAAVNRVSGLIKTNKLDSKLRNESYCKANFGTHASQVIMDAADIAMRIIPVNFNKEHKAMLGHCKMILENDPRKIAINPDRFDK